MDTNTLKKFAQETRRTLLTQIEARLEQVLRTDSVELREKLGVVNELNAKIAASSKESVIAEVAYTWFNRLCALRYMDVNHYTQSGIVSPQAGFTQPEVLQDAKQGIFDEDWRIDQTRVRGLLSGSVPSANGEQEAYRMLLVAGCNYYAHQMGFLFEAIEDYSELLMPEDLLSTQSVLHSVQETLTPEMCTDVEVIGWLYQFYISEKKDEVMGGKGAVAKADIPAVTQLFTPDWIVRYMVQNSLGRLWLLNHPDSKIAEEMEYYIEPSPQSSPSGGGSTPSPRSSFGGGEGSGSDSPLLMGEGPGVRVNSPEEIKFLEPACGSGHILTYAFDLLYAIYEEQGYDAPTIPKLILEKNLYGIEIDRRAAQLAGFALMMKARSKDRRFLQRNVQPNVLEMVDVSFTSQEINDYLAKLGRDLWTQDLWEGLKQFENAKTFGALIRPVIHDVPELRQRMEAQGVFADLFLSATNEKVEKVLEMAEYLSPRYQVVVANPPYFSKGMDADYKKFAKDQYPDSKVDALAMFIERNLESAKKGGYVGMVTLMSWMFLSSYEKLRMRILNENTILGMGHLGARAFDTIGGEVVSTTMFILQNEHRLDYKGDYFRLVDGGSEAEKQADFSEAIANPECGWFFRASAADFKKIPGAPIAYWVSDRVRQVFEEGNPFKGLAKIKHGLSTGKNVAVVRYWSEVPIIEIGFGFNNRDLAKKSEKKWFPYNKGGEFRKWYGNNFYVLNYDSHGIELMSTFSGHRHDGKSHYFQQSITWSFISSSYFGVRYSKPGAIFDVAGSSAFPRDKDIKWLTGFMCSKLSTIFMKTMNPTLNFQVGNVASLPIIDIKNKDIAALRVQELIALSQTDWNSYETSWDFTENTLLKDKTQQTLQQRYQTVREEWHTMTEEMLRLEEENNRIFIEAYGLQEELIPDVPLEEITLTCNPHYRYKGNLTDKKREARLLEDTIKEFISYAVGCLFGRYSLDKPGLILANQGETLQDYLRILSSPSGRGTQGEGINSVMSANQEPSSHPSPSGRRGIDPSSQSTPHWRRSLTSQLRENARRLRRNATDAEQLLWSCLRDRQLNDLKFRRQHPVAPYVLDFYCHELKLGIELDGSGHLDQQQEIHDENRTAILNRQGIEILRFWNNDVFNHIEAVLEQILDTAEDIQASQALSSKASLAVGKSFLSSPTGRGTQGEGINSVMSANQEPSSQPSPNGRRSFAPSAKSTPTILPTETNVLPILDGDWFGDDIVARFKDFLKVSFGEAEYDDNLRFIEDALGKDLRAYFLKNFYKDHVKTYKKRPIYWQFSSAKGSFNALIYMHRYQPETVSVMLNSYLRAYREKLNAQRRTLESLSGSAGASSREKTRALKEVEAIAKVQAELKDYEESILYPLATRQIEIDLDDGVKVNYAKFGKALKKI